MFGRKDSDDPQSHTHDEPAPVTVMQTSPRLSSSPAISPRPASLARRVASTPSDDRNGAAERKLTVGKGLSLAGEITSCDVLVVEGKVEAKKVVLTSTAHMSGDVVHQDIRIESGAYIDGHCRPEYGKTESRTSSAPKTISSPPREVSASPGRDLSAPEKPNGAGAKI